MTLEENFKNACVSVTKFTKLPPENDLSELYALYKQATIGDIKIGKPSDEKGIKKWNLWNSKKGLESKRAKELYIEKYKILAPKYA